MSGHRLRIDQLTGSQSLKARAYDALKAAITAMDIYAPDAELRLDERDLSARFGISRTPLREALALLEREGIVQVVSRRGVFIVRKSRPEILDMVTVWAALESMAARLAVTNASDEQLSSLRVLAEDDSASTAPAVRYAETNIRFHRAIQQAGHNSVVDRVADGLFFHMRAVRRHATWTEERRQRSLADHRDIVRAIEMRHADEAERLVREHTLRLRDHIDQTFDIN